MANCVIKNPPEFALEVPKWDKGTRDNGIEMSEPLEEIFNNTMYNKAEIERLEGTLLKGITIPMAGWSNQTYAISNPTITVESEVTVLYDFNSIPVAQKASIRGRTEAGKLVLVAKKTPVADLTIERIRIVNLN